MAHPPPPPSARRDELFVGGAWTPGTGRERFPVISPTSEELLQISLNHKRLSVSWGPRGARPRSQTLLFDTPDQARDAYFTRLGALDARGYLDTTAG